MSNFKNFAQQGVSSDVQFGKGGGRIVFRDGVFHVVTTPTGDELARFQVGAAIDPADAINLGELTLAVNHVYAKVDRTSAAVDAQLTAMKTAISTIRLDGIVSLDQSYGLHAETAGLNLMSGAFRFGSINTDAQTDTGFLLNTIKGCVKLAAVSPGDADVRIVPAGQGSVIIGDGSEDGVIQPEGGHSLTVAGGDADQAGSVIIRGGHGTTPGHVEIHDLVDPVQDQDPVTLSSAKASLAKLATTITTGSIRASIGSFHEVLGDTQVMQIPAGTLLCLKVLVIEAFTEGCAITVKTSNGVLALPTAIDESQPGIYSIELLQDTPADTISVNVTTAGSGTASLALEYIAA